jgi:hypothetical protein
MRTRPSQNPRGQVGTVGVGRTGDSSKPPIEQDKVLSDGVEDGDSNMQVFGTYHPLAGAKSTMEGFISEQRASYPKDEVGTVGVGRTGDSSKPPIEQDKVLSDGVEDGDMQ